MIFQELVDRFSRIELLLEFCPSTLENFAHGEIKHLLYEVVHPRTEGKDSSFPCLEFGVLGAFPPRWSFEVLGPSFEEDSFEMFEAEKVTEDHLIVRD